MTPARPQFSIVTAVYNVEPYLPEFIASIEAQRFDLGRIEVIAVDDGSTDGSLALLEAWAARRPELVTVLRQPNGGQGSARNLGLEHATGEWVTFTDPDDMLDRDFFRVTDRFAAAHVDVEVMASRPLILEDGPGRISDTHRRRNQYLGGSRLVNLDDHPNTFGSATVSLYRLDRIREQGLRFDPRIRPNFEDGHFAVCYLLRLPAPVVGIVREATYFYRRRVAGNSATQLSHGEPGRYDDVLRFGYLDVLERSRARYGAVPPWVQHVLIYELARYLAEDEKLSTSIRISDDLVPLFHDLLGQVVAQLDPDVVLAHAVRRLKSVWIDILSHGCRPDAWHSPAAVQTKVDKQMGLQRVCYRYVGVPPPEEFLVNGVQVQPAYGKRMGHIYYGRSLMQERVAWVPLQGTLEVRLDGRPFPVVTSWPTHGGSSARRAPRTQAARDRTGPRRITVGAVARRIRKLASRVVTVPLRVLARMPPYAATFRDAWALMDRIFNADDNAERLFEYLRAERPDINAWFIVERDTPDWRRLRAAGTTRLVAYGSLRWKLLMLNCRWLISSHAGQPVAEPAQIIRITGKPTWKYAFLQHGVMKDDLSRWFNRRDMDLFVVSTVPELESVVADGTGYEVTTKETRNTGLPRFDRLLARGREVAPDDRDLVIVAPTWRIWLTGVIDLSSQRRGIDPAFWESEYLQSWMTILRSPEIAAGVEARGHRLAFMPHPDMQPILAQLELPAHVEPLTFDGNDVQALYARCALLVTDYSSVAFNAACLDRPVVYYQFDRDEVLGGAHLGRRGYFEYERDGFGPVATDAADAVRAIVAAIEHGPQPTPAYQARIDRTFVDRDGQACARVVAAIEELSRRYEPASSGST